MYRTTCFYTLHHFPFTSISYSMTWQLQIKPMSREWYLDEDGEYEHFGLHFDIGTVVGVRLHVGSDDGAVLVVGEVGAGLVARGGWFGFVAWTAQEAGSARQAGFDMRLRGVYISGWVHPSSCCAVQPEEHQRITYRTVTWQITYSIP